LDGLADTLGGPIHPRFPESFDLTETHFRRTVMNRKYVLCFALASLFALQVDSASACRGINVMKNGEMLCMTTSDSSGYTDGRSGRDRWIEMRQRQMQEREQQERRARFEGRHHTQDMASGGTQMAGVLVSPFVPGSTQDKAWQSERKHRGLCPNSPDPSKRDRFCDNAQ
jgi:hypothetical protein